MAFVRRIRWTGGVDQRAAGGNMGVEKAVGTGSQVVVGEI